MTKKAQKKPTPKNERCAPRYRRSKRLCPLCQRYLHFKYPPGHKKATALVCFPCGTIIGGEQLELFCASNFTT